MTERINRLRSGLPIVMAIAIVLLVIPIAATAHAAGATYVVNSTLDEPDADPSNGVCSSTPSGKCTLRAAIMTANFATGPNTITVPCGTFTLTRPGYDDAALVGDLDIAHDLTIEGAGPGMTIVDGNGAVTGDRVFQILNTAQNVALSGMTIRNGKSLASTVGVIGGGGLYMEGSGHLHLSDVIIEGNTGQNGGALYTNLSSQGGLIEMDNVIVRANTVTAGGVGAGGGIFAYIPSNLSQVLIRDSQVYGNTADGTGGGLFVDGNQTTQWSIQRSVIYSNTAASGGAIGNLVPLVLSDSSLHDNHVTLDGGAIEAFSPFVISRTALDANMASRFGGGIFALQTSSNALYPEFAHIAETTLSHNAAQYGGGIYHDGFITSGSLLTLLNSTLSGNTVLRPFTAMGGANGGAIDVFSGQLQLVNTTIAGNRVQLSLVHPYPGMGGGLYFDCPRNPDMTCVTGSSPTFNALNSLIANNARGNGVTPDVADDCYSLGGTTGSLSYDLIRDMTNCFVSGPQVGTIVGQDPLLGPLQDNGGLTQTLALLSGSPAIDAGTPAGCLDDMGAALTVDQRDAPRGANACDIGAYEYGAVAPTTSTSTSTLSSIVCTTSTTTEPASTTTTTLAASRCASVTGFDGVQCVCRGGIASAACAADHVPAAVVHLFQHGCTSMKHAAALTSRRKVKKAVRGSAGAFEKALTKVAKATRKHKLSGACSGALGGTLGDVKQRTDRILVEGTQVR